MSQQQPAGRRAYLLSAARATGLYVVGQPGTGKSKLLEALARHDILAGNGVGFLDPHGDVFTNLTLHLAAAWKSNPQLHKRLVILDPTNPDWSERFNPLQVVPGIPLERVAWSLGDVVSKVWKLDSAGSPRLSFVMLNTFTALAERVSAIKPS